jgi:hypothetical protein
MSELVQTGYLSRLEAVDIIVRSLVAGRADQPHVTKLREEGIDAADGAAIDVANAELWRGVDRGNVEVFACGANGQRFRLEGSLTQEVLFLRSSREGDFTYSRSGTSAHTKLVAQFGPNLGSVSLAFAKRDVEKWARVLLRRRRRGSVSTVGKRPAGRPSRQTLAIPVIQKLIDDEKWNTTMSLKALAQQVNRCVESDKAISEETVTRALDQLFEETSDRRFQRIRRKAA